MNDYNDICEKIISVEGNCFAKDGPSCSQCPFKIECIYKMIVSAEYIPASTRFEWAMSRVCENFILGENK
jgi:hypothetical protein